MQCPALSLTTQQQSSTHTTMIGLRSVAVNSARLIRISFGRRQPLRKLFFRPLSHHECPAQIDAHRIACVDEEALLPTDVLTVSSCRFQKPRLSETPNTGRIFRAVPALSFLASSPDWQYVWRHRSTSAGVSSVSVRQCFCKPSLFQFYAALRRYTWCQP